MSQPATKDDLKNLGKSLHADIKDLARHFTTTFGKHGDRLDSIDGRLEHIETDLTQVNTKLDAIMSGEILVTRKQIERLINALESQGIKLNISEILAA